MLNGVFFFLIVSSVLVAAFTGTMPKLTSDGAEAGNQRSNSGSGLSLPTGRAKT